MHENTGSQFHPHILRMMIVEPIYVGWGCLGFHYETPQVLTETPTLERRNKFFRTDGEFAVY
jgi:hypothetical protein